MVDPVSLLTNQPVATAASLPLQMMMPCEQVCALPACLLWYAFIEWMMPYTMYIFYYDNQNLAACKLCLLPDGKNATALSKDGNASLVIAKVRYIHHHNLHKSAEILTFYLYR